MGSERLSTLSVTKDNMADLPGYCALTFTLMPVGSTSRRSVQVQGFASIGPLTPPCRLYPLPVRQASALPTASSRFRLATDTLAVQLTLPLAGCVGDSHPQVSEPCRAHQKERGGFEPPRTIDSSEEALERKLGFSLDNTMSNLVIGIPEIHASGGLQQIAILVELQGQCRIACSVEGANRVVKEVVSGEPEG